MPKHRGPLSVANIVTRRAFNSRKRELTTRGMPLCKISTQSLARMISKGLQQSRSHNNYMPLRISNKTKSKHKRLLK